MAQILGTVLKIVVYVSNVREVVNLGRFEHHCDGQRMNRGIAPLLQLATLFYCRYDVANPLVVEIA